ncbi:hypothetical protein PIB30_059540 [Stylosanthes scabra]|uniref:HTH La-type RNA-binding domain-containing protein n=1 Tax=Stylosanthes scabra TaxID=79078 RepID=A0ABU6UMD0_9FABA|nr:hypothetical protein [Stylosanthes scabra]
MAHPGAIRGPPPRHFVPYPVNPASQSLPPETSRLLTSEPFLGSDENLQNDHYLISLMDDQGWVPISIVAGFKRVKKMSTDIPFILDALQSSDVVEVQGEKIRTCNNWSKWIRGSSGNLGSSAEQAQPSQVLEDAVKSSENTEVDGDKTKDISEANFKDAAQNDIQSKTDTLQSSHLNHEHYTESHCSNNNSDAATGQRVKYSNYNTNKSNLSFYYKETEAKIFDDTETGNADVSVDTDVRDLSNDFGHTFMLDEEIELEQKMQKKTEISSPRRYFTVTIYSCLLIYIFPVLFSLFF